MSAFHRVPSFDLDADYPCSDGKPMADSTIQARWMKMIHDNLDAMLPDDFVAIDLLWYPVQGHREISAAPDVLVALGRPKGDRRSYRHWREEGVAPQVVFEVWSHHNTPQDAVDKHAWYEKYGVQENYTWDPERLELGGYLRRNGQLEPIPMNRGWTSPLPGVRLTKEDGDLVLYDREGRRFRSWLELKEATDRAQAEAERAQAEAERAQAEARLERARAESLERAQARLLERLRAAGIDPATL